MTLDAARITTFPEVFQGDAHAYLMAIYKDPAQETAVRIDAAGGYFSGPMAPLAFDDHEMDVLLRCAAPPGIFAQYNLFVYCATAPVWRLITEQAPADSERFEYNPRATRDGDCADGGYDRIVECALVEA